MEAIRHIWFDFSDTLAFVRKEHMQRFRYATYAEVTGKPVNGDLIAAYERLRKKFSYSNSALFRSLGLPANFWSERINKVDPQKLYTLADSSVPIVLNQLRQTMPISIFSNLRLDTVLPALHMKTTWFTHIISSGMVKEPKPALDGFYKMIELSRLQPEEILYIGDHVEKDVRPAKQVGIKTGILWNQSDEADFSFEKFADILDIAGITAKHLDRLPKHQ